MPGNLLTVSAQVVCMHMGQAMAATPSPRVTVGGDPAVTISASYSIAGCPFVPPAGTGPCATAQWLVGTTRVTSDGEPLLIEGGSAVCVPTGTGLQVMVTQPQVSAI
jgi:hypothetical protein